MVKTIAIPASVPLGASPSPGEAPGKGKMELLPAREPQDLYCTHSSHPASPQLKKRRRSREGAPPPWTRDRPPPWTRDRGEEGLPASLQATLDRVLDSLAPQLKAAPGEPSDWEALPPYVRAQIVSTLGGIVETAAVTRWLDATALQEARDLLPPVDEIS